MATFIQVMQIPTNLLIVIVIALVAGAGSVGLTTVDFFTSLEAEGKSICGETQGGFKNGSNRFLCPPQG